MSEAARPDAPALRVRALKKSFETRAGSLCVLDGVDFELLSSETLAVVGPSGSGKSTLLHIIGTLDRPTDGEVLIAGTNPFTLSETELAGFRNRHVGFVFQEHYLLPQLSVLENVVMPSLAAKGARRAGEESIEERARRLVDRVGLSERLEHLPAELSGGERQRVAIARALILRPLLVLCDEPTGNLDRRTAASVAELLMEVHRDEESALIIVTHSAELAAKCDRTLDLDAGELRVE